MKYKNFFTALVLLGVVVVPSVGLAQYQFNAVGKTNISALAINTQTQEIDKMRLRDTQKGLQNLRQNFLKDERNDEKRMKDLFGSESNVRAIGITGIVTSVNGALLNITINNDKAYAVDTTNAVITRNSGATIGLAEIALQDKVVVRGTLNGNTITATSIRDLSLRVRNAHFYGTIFSLNASVNSFVLTTEKNGQQTVQLSSSSTIKKNGNVMNFSDLVVGQHVYVAGSWNVRTNVIASVIVEIINRWNAIFLQGIVTAKTDATLTVKRADGIIYTINTTRGMIVSRFYNILTTSDVNVGDMVLVGGIHLNDSTDVRAFIVHDKTNTSGTL